MDIVLEFAVLVVSGVVVDIAARRVWVRKPRIQYLARRPPPLPPPRPHHPIERPEHTIIIRHEYPYPSHEAPRKPRQKRTKKAPPTE